MYNATELYYRIALTQLENVGPKSARNILSIYDHAEEFFKDNHFRKKQIPGFTRERLQKINRTIALEKAKREIDFIAKNEVTPYFYKDENFPFRLKECPDTPILIYGKGDFNTNPKRAVAVVGTRKVTSYGKELVEQLIADLAQHHVQVISGMAYGVDVLAHKACLKHGVSTIGVLGHGLDRLYPYQHREIAHKMIASDGGLLTEFISGTNPDRENFPKRNRIVAGMTDATIVIESGEKGGSLITALLANDYARDVFAFPGNINSTYSIGCNQLIANQKAHLVTGAKDIIKLMGWDYQPKTTIQAQLFPDLNKEESVVFNCIRNHKLISVDQLSVQLKQPVSKLNGTLLSLELQGVVLAQPGNKFKAI